MQNVSRKPQNSFLRKKNIKFENKTFYMLTKEMKQELIDKINSTKDENILEEVYRILEVGFEEVDMIVLTNEQKESIDQGIKDIEEGKYLSNEEANSEIEKWLKK